MKRPNLDIRIWMPNRTVKYLFFISHNQSITQLISFQKHDEKTTVFRDQCFQEFGPWGYSHRAGGRDFGVSSPCGASSYWPCANYHLTCILVHTTYSTCLGITFSSLVTLGVFTSPTISWFAKTTSWDQSFGFNTKFATITNDLIKFTF